MTERELFEAIGHVDDDLILAADAPVKKRRPPVYWWNVTSVAACACIFLGSVAVWQSGKLHNNNTVETAMESSAYDKSASAVSEDVPMVGAAAPQSELAEGAEAAESASNEMDSAASSIALGLAQCVQIDGVRYFESANAVDFTADREADGVITDSVAADAFPEADNCSNFGAGYSYWLSGEDTVVVEIDGVYWEFKAN